MSDRVRLLVAPWSLPCARPVTVGAVTSSSRAGLVVALGRGNAWGFGDAAPLPGLSRETLAEVIAAVRTLPCRSPATLSDLDAVTPMPPSLAFALVSAALDLRAGGAAASLRTACLLGDDDACAWEHSARPCAVVKLKVGRAPLATEIARVQRLRDAGARLRLDGNRRLDADGARALVRAAGSALDFFEEPTSPTQLHAVDGPLALDESIGEALASGAPGALAALPPAVAWVLKPTVLGSRGVAAALSAAKRPRIILSSAYDSAVGRRALVRLGAALGLAGEMHGLGTAAFLCVDVESVPRCLVEHVDGVSLDGALTPSAFARLDWQEVW